MRNRDRHMKMNPDDSRALVVGAVNLAELGDREQAIAWAERAIDASDDEPVICYNSACTFAVLGESNRALDLLERAVALAGAIANGSRTTATWLRCTATRAFATCSGASTDGHAGAVVAPAPLLHRVAPPPRDPRGHRLRGRRLGHRRGEIGRASCREGVCQCV